MTTTHLPDQRTAELEAAELTVMVLELCLKDTKAAVLHAADGGKLPPFIVYAVLSSCCVPGAMPTLGV